MQKQSFSIVHHCPFLFQVLVKSTVDTTEGADEESDPSTARLGRASLEELVSDALVSEGKYNIKNEVRERVAAGRRCKRGDAEGIHTTGDSVCARTCESEARTLDGLSRVSLQVACVFGVSPAGSRSAAPSDCHPFSES